MNNRIVRSQWGLYTIHLMRRSRCFVFDEQLRVCEVLTSQNQSVQLRLICIYVCPTSAHRGFRYGYRRYKGNTFILETTLFGWQSMILRFVLGYCNSYYCRIWRPLSSNRHGSCSINAVFIVRRCYNRFAIWCHYRQLPWRTTRISQKQVS